MIAAITTPKPIPINIDATNNSAEVCKKINPTPIPRSVIPPMIHELLSELFFVSFISVSPDLCMSC
jgi:hypothetical protein